MLNLKGIRAIGSAVDNLFDRMKTKLLGSRNQDKKIAVRFTHGESLQGLYEAAVSQEGAVPSASSIGSIHKIAASYLDATKEQTKARLIKEINATIEESKGEAVSIIPELTERLNDVFRKATSDVNRIVSSEAQNSRTLGLLEGIVKINERVDVDDPTVFFIIVRDQHVCEECKRIHMLPDGITPRTFKLSEVSHGYHKHGEDTPCVSGLHPHCRCTMGTLLPGTGFDKHGFITFVDVDHDEHARQRSLSDNK
ncbi:hypothetical protein UFOVP75_93 [uncultured Caudovirales phage]|uniref:Uncharacterized protein n=1 Tax=uncultured Caudovirales phage TaxID=2100421 RepID=A0A6J5KYV5_9CAUD|nr:hypothetical protein UFOVP75_93 [uncultured Caudovirales phage]